MGNGVRRAVAVTAAALLTGVIGLATPAHAATGVLVAQASDPAGDPHVDVRGDATSARVSQSAGTITLTITVPHSTDPRTDRNWTAGASAADWFLETNGDDNPDFLVDLISDNGTLDTAVFDEGNNQRCSGTSAYSGGVFTATIPSSCIGNPASVRFSAELSYDTNPDSNDPGAVSVDDVPNTGWSSPWAAQGYWLLGRDGGVFTFGNADFHGSTGDITLNKPVVGMAGTPSGNGYWFVASDGGVFSYGDAQFFGSTGDITLNKPIVGMAATPTGNGYWLVASDGGIFAFGDAQFFGSTGNITLNAPIVGMSTTPDGMGYWLVATDGGIFSYGNAAFYGSTGNLKLAKPIVGMTTSPDGNGYSFVASDGGVFVFGSAMFFGSAAPAPSPVVGMSSTATGKGYLLAMANGTVASFGDAADFGSTPPLTAPIVGLARQATPSNT